MHPLGRNRGPGRTVNWSLMAVARGLDPEDIVRSKKDMPARDQPVWVVFIEPVPQPEPTDVQGAVVSTQELRKVVFEVFQEVQGQGEPVQLHLARERQLAHYGIDPLHLTSRVHVDIAPGGSDGVRYTSSGPVSS
jgi:hypothetical protein